MTITHVSVGIDSHSANAAGCSRAGVRLHVWAIIHKICGGSGETGCNKSVTGDEPGEVGYQHLHCLQEQAFVWKRRICPSKNLKGTTSIIVFA